VCATNSVRSLDRAFVRPGRFDYLIPIGPPDTAARQQVWGRYVAEITAGDVDVTALAVASDRFSPADIEFAAQRAAHAAFERSHNEGVDSPATTADFLTAISETRPSLADELIVAFEEDIAEFARS
jgi:SpoVK/Ycf46/Vps4 family AAA+-type ATPase